MQPVTGHPAGPRRPGTAKPVHLPPRAQNSGPRANRRDEAHRSSPGEAPARQTGGPVELHHHSRAGTKRRRPPVHASFPTALHPPSAAGGAAEAAPTLPHPSPPITTGHEEPWKQGTLSNATVETETSAPNEAMGWSASMPLQRTPRHTTGTRGIGPAGGWAGGTGQRRGPAACGVPGAPSARDLAREGEGGGGGKACTETGSWLWPGERKVGGGAGLQPSRFRKGHGAEGRMARGAT